MPLQNIGNSYNKKLKKGEDFGPVQKERRKQQKCTYESAFSDLTINL